MNDKLLILEDTDGDGKADKMTVFADDLHCPTGFEFYNGGVLVAQAPDLMFLKDTDGDDKADVRERVVSRPRLGRHAPHLQQLRARSGRGALLPGRHVPPHPGRDAVRPAACAAPTRGVFRYEPRTQKFDVYVTFGFANPHGHVFDRWGQDIVIDGTGAQPYHGTLFSGHLDLPAEARPAAAGLPAADPALPRHRVSSPAGTSPTRCRATCSSPTSSASRASCSTRSRTRAPASPAAELEPILSSTDPNFRPSDIEIGPDGAIYFIDWQNPIIGHMQHNLRDPSRDRTHGRDLPGHLRGPAAADAAEDRRRADREAARLLKEPEDRVRYRARIELGGRDDRRRSSPRSRSGSTGLDKNDPDYEHHLLEALWVHQYHNVVNVDLLKRMLDVARLPRPGRGDPRALLLARPRARCARAAQEAGGRRASARPARGGPGGQLLHRARGGRGRLDRGRAADATSTSTSSAARR